MTLSWNFVASGARMKGYTGACCSSSTDNRTAVIYCAMNVLVICIVQEHDKQADKCQQLHSQSEALQAVSGKVAAAEAAARAAEQRAEAAGVCAAEEVKKGQELVQAHAAELAHLQQRLQAAQV